MNTLLIVKKLTIPLVTLFAVGGLLIASGQAEALFKLTKNNLKATGTVVDVGSDEFMMDTGSTEPPFTVMVRNSTNYKGGYDSFFDIQIGDEVEVKASVEDDGFEARTVELLGESSYGYGGGCDKLHVKRAVVEAVSFDEITVEREGIEIIAEINDDTKIRGYMGNRQVNVGDTVDVRGEDCGGSFVAEKITVRRP